MNILFKLSVWFTVFNFFLNPQTKIGFDSSFNESVLTNENIYARLHIDTNRTNLKNEPIIIVINFVFGYLLVGLRASNCVK